MRRVTVVLSLVLLGLPIGQTAAARPLIEGQKGWDCRTMGNRTCSTGARVTELAGIIEGQAGWDCKTMGNGVCGATTSTTEDITSVMLTPASIGTTERVNVSSNEEQANGPSPHAPVDINRNGRFVVFISQATNLVPGDTNAIPDVFVRDRVLGTTERVTVSSTGVQADGVPDSDPSISPDGRHVAFTSSATNLVGGDTNGSPDVFVHDRRLHTTKRVSVGPLGIEANGSSGQPDISENGVIAFASHATNLTADEIALHTADPVVDASEVVITGVTDDIAETDNFTDVFVHTLSTGITERVSVNDLGSPASGPECGPEDCPNAGHPYSDEPSISADGRYVAFESNAENLVIDHAPLVPSVRLGPSDDNEAADVYVRDRLLRRTEWITTGEPFGGGSDPAISGDGRFVAVLGFQDVFVHDRDSDVMEQINVDSSENAGTGFSYRPAISDIGQKVAFASLDRLAPEDATTHHDIYVRDRRAGTTSLESVNSAGVQANFGAATLVALSGDGHAVAFASGSTNLVDGDTNGFFDVFVHSH